MGRRRNRDSANLEKAAYSVCLLVVLLLYLKGLISYLYVGIAGLIVLVGLILLIFFLVRRKKRRQYTDFESEFQSDHRTAPGRVADQVPKTSHRISDAPINSYQATTAKQEYRFSMDLLHELEWKRFEQLVEGYFARTGWRTRQARIGADGGVDIHLFNPTEDRAMAIVQCKAWASYKVGVKPVRELFGVMAADGVPEGYFVTTTDYTGEARDFAAGKRLTLIHGRDLLRRIESLPESDQANLLTMATAGDYTTPTCPRCGRKMVDRIARNTGNSFWGCPGFPRCQATLTQKSDGK